ncbi:DNA-3-methyladenine glycosylase I [Bdellovibrio sp. SKB1291214]|uniref:DNA-3-methyladenine glycosylase I n=1 Tax=Bdellovibrio sp. SKB1291214 TaxID=1732569 RepID=UPI000B51B19E
MSYCRAIAHMSDEKKAIHKPYHDKAYGFPIHDDDELFCRLILEINQAGLSWETILKKQDTFRKAYHNFNIKKVAAYKASDRARLMKDPGIIRNRLKINAAIENAKAILVIQKEFGSFKKWLAYHHPLTKEEWVKLFKKTFKFTGGEIVNEFLLSSGYLPGAHEKGCEVYNKIIKSKPMWNQKNKSKTMKPDTAAALKPTPGKKSKKKK